MRSLSSTISTRERRARASDGDVAMPNRCDYDTTIIDVEINSPTMVAADLFGLEWDACFLEGFPRCFDIALAECRSVIIQHIGEHRGAANDPRKKTASLSTRDDHVVDQEFDG